MLLYIHGFRTTEISHNATLFKNYFQEQIIVSDHCIVPNQAIRDLEAIVEGQNITGIIASSLGGFYATYLSQKYNLKAVLINPSTRPYITTKKYIGENQKDNGAKFIWTEEDVSMFNDFKVDTEQLKLKNYLLLLQTADEVVDYRYAHKLYQGAKVILEEGGNHKFEGLERFLEEIVEFFKS